jgi:tetratricopeptide (TPR) repeat protein
MDTGQFFYFRFIEDFAHAVIPLSAFAYLVLGGGSVLRKLVSRGAGTEHAASVDVSAQLLPVRNLARLGIASLNLAVLVSILFSLFPLYWEATRILGSTADALGAYESGELIYTIAPDKGDFTLATGHDYWGARWRNDQCNPKLNRTVAAIYGRESRQMANLYRKQSWNYERRFDDYASALDCDKKAYRIYRKLGDREKFSRCLEDIIWLLVRKGEKEEAAAYIRECLKLDSMEPDLRSSEIVSHRFMNLLNTAQKIDDSQLVAEVEKERDRQLALVRQPVQWQSPPCE